MTIQLAEYVERFGEPEIIRVRRDGDRDIEFRGWQIGKGATGA
jgi:hypothetical protein